jgi:hypothetical protein
MISRRPSGRLAGSPWRVALGALLATAAGAAGMTAQTTRTPIVRLEGGMLNPDDVTQTTLAFGGDVGWQLSRRQAILIRYLRQSQNRNSGTDIKRARGLLTLDWEYGFGRESQYHRQALVRLGGGALFRPGLATAALVSLGLEVRYAVGARWAFVGSVEDDVGVLPLQEFQSCSPLGSVCTTFSYGGKWQHNYGFLVAGEWRPSGAAPASP